MSIHAVQNVNLLIIVETCQITSIKQIEQIKVTMTKEESGLGLFKMKERNTALLSGLIRRLNNK